MGKQGTLILLVWFIFGAAAAGPETKRHVTRA